MKSIITIAIVLAAVAFHASIAFAHRDDYLNETIVYLTLERGEVETEYWFDRGRNSDVPAYFNRHNVAIEWGITNKFMADGRFTLVSDRLNGTKFDSQRFESRYRFSDEGVQPVDIAVSLEVNSEREDDGSVVAGIEPRLILSKDIKEKLNFTINLSEEIPFDNGSSAILGAFGSRFNWTEPVRIGSEFQYDFSSHSGSAIPQVWFAFRRRVNLKLGYAAGINSESNDFARAALEVEF